MDKVVLVATIAFSVESILHFACAPSDYLPQRWNLTAGYTLRFLTYDIVNEGESS